MSYVWEEDFDIFCEDVPRSLCWHLKRLVQRDPNAIPPFRITNGPYKVSLAWITREGERKYNVRFMRDVRTNNNKTFRSLKAAKAYALAIITLEQ